ncbi:UNVERIFIED_CONTAM: hypothetical protein Sradi_0319100 [Sesamum radiatum]|uniref:Translation elongation factor KOW-like domain-containing protein n=1 Tax=Sesamum radiatum TaxID=300843 RepID=A0AAW2W7F0_SESRA
MVRHPASPRQILRRRCIEFIDVLVATNLQIVLFMSIFMLVQVIKAQHTSQGRGGAIIQVELRDVDSGSKVNERLRTDEPVQTFGPTLNPVDGIYSIVEVL